MGQEFKPQITAHLRVDIIAKPPRILCQFEDNLDRTPNERLMVILEMMARIKECIQQEQYKVNAELHQITMEMDIK